MRKARGLFSNLEKQSSKSLQPSFKNPEKQRGSCEMVKGPCCLGGGEGPEPRAHVQGRPASGMPLRNRLEHRSDFLNCQNTTDGHEEEGRGPQGPLWPDGLMSSGHGFLVSLEARAGAK